VKDVFALLVFMIIFAGFVFFTPNLLGHTDNYIQANPLQTPEHIVPEWYFLPFYAILRAIPDKLGGVIMMVSAIAILAFLPWLDTSKVRSAKYRPLFKQFYWIFLANFLLLGYLGAMPAEGIYVIISRIATIYYFVHFIIILPVLGFVEKTKPLPKSISEPVLNDKERAAKAATATA
jgi:ubiquinol-cytochrome c reductase cytochrome b subunit